MHSNSMPHVVGCKAAQCRQPYQLGTCGGSFSQCCHLVLQTAPGMENVWTLVLTRRRVIVSMTQEQRKDWTTHTSMLVCEQFVLLFVTNTHNAIY